ncbi:hypothetical protein GCM10007301_27230 [Azorhizobium oxalatiphilum]|uniref:Uncharacterized protein n=1 Tax=Azorhizobium oxalatiphilum TaxID=980631 RepID=A0A917C2S5_9HYPH|nr:hypothetical protein [Azorhizobium oxalatiphilum]GGF66109.1 hypothetical protein GCM10007301_27230 [Azorhizobium oxalatiphilum]
MSADVIAVNFAKLSRLPLARILEGSGADTVELLHSIRALAGELKTECEAILALSHTEPHQREFAEAGLSSAETLLRVTSGLPEEAPCLS